MHADISTITSTKGRLCVPKGSACTRSTQVISQIFWLLKLSLKLQPDQSPPGEMYSTGNRNPVSS